MFKKFTATLNNRLIKWNELDKEEQAYLKFGFQILLILISDLFVILLLAYIFNMFWPVAIAILSFLIIRPYIGGVHMPSYLLCMIVSLLIFLAIGIISISISLSIYSIIIWIIIAFFISLMMINKYAPADTETIPITDPKQRELLKTKARNIIFIWISISLLTALIFQNYLELIFASSLGLLSNIMLIHPIVYHLVQKYLPKHK